MRPRSEWSDEEIPAAAARILEERAKYGDTLTSPNAVREYFKVSLATRELEIFVGVFLDAQHRVIAFEELARGTLTQTSVYTGV